MSLAVKCQLGLFGVLNNEDQIKLPIHFLIRGKWFKTVPGTLVPEGVSTGILTEGVPGS